MKEEEEELKRMPIYADQRVENELKQLLKENGTTRDDAHWEEKNVTPDDLYACSSMHYHVNTEKPTDAIVRILRSLEESASPPSTRTCTTETERPILGWILES